MSLLAPPRPDLRPAAPPTRYTRAEFEALLADPANSDRLLELVHGEIIEKMPTQRHGLTAVILSGEMYIYLKEHPIGRLGSEVRHALPDDEQNDRIPDLSLILDQSRPVVERGPVPRMPDLAIEIKSPTDSYAQMREKANYYLEHGAQMVWLVYPEKSLIEVYRAGGEIEFYTAQDELPGEPLLPGFRLNLAALFAD
jgi:Uma2 family endonuclease